MLHSKSQNILEVHVFLLGQSVHSNIAPGVAGYDIPTASALGDCSTVCWMDGWQTCHARMRFSVLRGSQSHVRQNVA